MQNLFRKIKIRFFGESLIWLFYKLKLNIFKRALNIQILLRNKLKYQLRLLDTDSRSEGFDEKFDMLLHIASIRLAQPEIFDVELRKIFFQNVPGDLLRMHQKLIDDYQANKSSVDQFIDRALKNNDVQRTLEMHALVKQFCFMERKEGEAAEICLNEARRYNPNASLPEVNFFELEKQTRRDLRNLEIQISDREATKLELSLVTIGTIISLVSPFFLISGYLYNRKLLGHFGIEVSSFFSLSDYLSSSLERIEDSAFVATLSIISHFVGRHHSSRKSYARVKLENMRRSRLDYYFEYLPILAVTISAIFLYQKDSVGYYSCLFFICIFLTYRITPWISRHYFKDPMGANFLLLFTFIFFAELYTAVGMNIHRLEHESIEKLRKYEIMFNDSLPFDPTEVALIAANSNYIFLLGVDKQIYIVPRSQIKFATVHKRSEH